jgi:hypothetical protein
LREHTLKNMKKPLNVYECLTQSDIEVLNKPRPGLLNTAMNFFSKSNTSSQNKTDAMIFIENLALFIKEYTSSHVFTEPSVTANSRVKNEEKEKINPISENAEVKSAEASNVDTKKTQDPDANSENNQAPTPG